MDEEVVKAERYLPPFLKSKVSEPQAFAGTAPSRFVKADIAEARHIAIHLLKPGPQHP